MNHNNNVLDIVNAAGMEETYGTYADDECFDIHDYDDDTDHDTDDDTGDDTDDATNDDTDDDTDDGGRGKCRDCACVVTRIRKRMSLGDG